MESSLFEPFLVDRTLECLISLVEGDPGVSSLFVPFCDFASILEFLEGLLPELPKTPATLTVRNIVSCILKRYGSSEVDLDAELAACDMGNSTDQAVKFLLPFLKGQREVQKNDETACHHIAFYLLIFIETYPGIRQVMKESVSKLMKKVGDATLFSILGSDFMFLYDEDPPVELVKTADLDFSDLPMLFRAPPVYKFPDFGKIIQQRACQLYQFPTEIPRVENGWTLSLANSVVSSATSFIDIMSQMVLEHLSTGEFDQIAEVTAGFEELVPFLLCGHQNLIYADLHGCMPLLQREYPKSIAAECLQRFRNDANLVGMLTHVTSSEVCVADLQYVSIPKQLEFCLNNPDILKFASLKYFSYGEKDTEVDFDFIKAFQVLETFLNLLSAGAQKMKQSLSEIAKLLASIVDKETLKKVVIDVFSLLFLKKDDKFVVTSPVAKQTLMILDKFNVCPQVKHGLKFITDKVEYNAQFKRDPTDIFKAIEAKNWALADRLTNAVPKYRNLFLMALSIYTTLEERKIPEEGAKCNELINLEILFSFFSGKELMNVQKEAQTPQKDAQPAQKEGYGRLFSQFKDFIMQTGETVVMPEECAYIPFVGKSYAEMTATISELCKSMGMDEEKFKALCAIREKTRDDSMFQVLPNYDKWQPLNEMVDMFENNFIEFISSGQQQLVDFSMAVSLKEFLIYIEHYYKAAMLCTNGNEKGVFEGFDLRRAISGVFNIGNLERAEEWCKKAKTTLFDYVLKNLDWFTLSQQFIDKYQDEYPTEIICLCETVPGLTTTKKSLVFDIKNEEPVEEWNEQQEIDEILAKVKSGADINFDDILFRVDPHQLYRRIMASVDGGEHLPEPLYKLLRLVDYAGEEQDSHKLKMIELSHELGANSNEQIIDKFIGAQQFDRLYSFLDHNLECLPYVLEQYLKLDIGLESLLYRFPALIPDVVRRFEFDITKVDLLLKFAPESRRRYLYAVRHLPAVVKESCNVLKLDEVKAFFVAHPALLEYVGRDVHDILTDDVVIELLNSMSGSFLLYTRIYQALSRNLVENPAQLFAIWHEQATKFIEGISVDSYDAERDALKGLSVILATLSGNQDLADEFNQVAFIRDFVGLGPYVQAHICYNFRAFRDPAKIGEALMGYLHRFDASLSWAERCRSVFGASLDNFYLNTCAQMIRLGLVKDAKAYFMELKKTVKTIYIEDLCLYSDPVGRRDIDMTIPFLYLLDRHAVFDREQIAAVSITEPTLKSYNSLKYIRDVLASDQKSSANKPEVRYYTAHAVRQGTNISMLIYNDSYDLAYQQLVSMRDDKLRATAFIHNFYYPSMCTGKLQKFIKCLLTQDPELQSTKQLIFKLLRFLQSHDLFYGTLEIAKMANRYDEAADAAIAIYHTATTHETRVQNLCLADYFLQQALVLREKHEPVKPPYVRTSATDEELEDKERLVKLQLAVLQICQKRKLPFDASFDVVFEKAALANAGAYFILMRDDAHKDEILQTRKVQLMDIVNRLAVIMTNLDEKEIISFVQEYRHKDPGLLNLIIPKLLQTLAMAFSSELVLKIISLAFDDLRTQGGLFYEFGFLYEALAPAAEDPSIIPLVAHRASELGIDVLVEQCLALLRL